VAHSLSAKKRVRQNVKHRARNRARKMKIRSEVKSFITTLGAGDMKKAEEQLRKAVQVMDKIAVKGTIHKNAASRKHNRLTKRLNAARAAGTSGGPGGKGTAAAKA
jgi:small subunit ribosomal protein S20